MANTARTQVSLSQSPHFQSRVKSALAIVAWQILNEDVNIPFHSQRANYARTALNQLDSATSSIVGWLVERTNVINFATSYDFDIGTTVTASGDPDIQSQLNSDWNFIAGV